MTNQPGNEKAPELEEPQVHIWLWRSSACLFAVVLVIGLGLAMALALGWRSPTLRRAPDWTVDDLTWKQYGNGTANLSAEGYQMRLSQSGNSIWAIAQHLVDFDVELDLRALVPDSEADYGLLYRYQNASNHYLFAIGSDGYFAITLVQDSKAVQLHTWREWPHVRRGTATNRLRVRCQGATCHFYINNEYAAEIIDHTFLEGDLGVWAQSFSDTPLEVVLEGMRIWSLN